MVSLISCIQIREETLKAPYYSKLLMHLVSPSHKQQFTIHGLVKRFNRSLLQMLRAYVDQTDWEPYLPFVLYAYHTAVHRSTGASEGSHYLSWCLADVLTSHQFHLIWLMIPLPTSISFKLSCASIGILLKLTTPKLACSRNITMMVTLFLELLLLMILSNTGYRKWLTIQLQCS